MVLVDTSVWIDFFRAFSSKEKQKLVDLIGQDEDIVISGIILQEILQGIRSDLEYHRLKKYFGDLTYLTLEEPFIFESAAQIYRNCRKKGKTVRKPIDCLIAAIAIYYHIPLLQKDADFEQIAKCNPLILLPFD